MFWCKRSSVPVNGGHHLKCSRPCSSFFGDADAGVVALSYAQSMTHQLQGSLTFYPSKVLTCHWWKLDYSQFFTILFATMLLKTMVMTWTGPKKLKKTMQLSRQPAGPSYPTYILCQASHNHRFQQHHLGIFQQVHSMLPLLGVADGHIIADDVLEISKMNRWKVHTFFWWSHMSRGWITSWLFN